MVADVRPDADVEPRVGFDAAPAVDVPPASGGVVLAGGVVTLPGVGVPVLTPGFPVGDVAVGLVGALLVAGTQGKIVGGSGGGGGMTAGMFAGLPVGVGWAGAVVDGFCPDVLGVGA